MSTTTTNYGLIKPDTTDPILVEQLNDNADTIDATMKSISDALDVAKLGIKYKGEVNYYSNLPSSGNQIGDAYTVKYAGSSGTTPDGTEYVWGTVSGTNQWINFSKDSYTKAEVDALLALKQNALTTTQLDAVNSGIDSTKVGQIETNKNNILYNTNMGVKNLAPVSIVDKIATSEGFTVKTNCRLTAGDYVISFDYTSTSSATPAFFNSNGVLKKQLTTINGSGHKSLPFTVTSQDDIAGYYFYTVRAAKFENIMIRPAFIEDDTFEPYAMSNAELTAKEQQNENNISSLTAELAKYVIAEKMLKLNPTGETPDVTMSQTGSSDGWWISNGVSIAGISRILSICITGFGSIREGDVIIPCTTNDKSQLRITTNTGTFKANATIMVQVFGLSS